LNDAVKRRAKYGRKLNHCIEVIINNRKLVLFICTEMEGCVIGEILKIFPSDKVDCL
jgi:hypothetical protein